MTEPLKHFLYPAALMASRSPHIVTTILGSCVAVCLWEQRQAFGGINHFMLPLWNGKGLASPKYGNIAIEKLISKMYSLGADKKYLIAKVFGGGEVIETQQQNFHIGERNIVIAKQLLIEYGIPIIGTSVGGKTGRKIIFNTFTGEVMMKYVG